MYFSLRCEHCDQRFKVEQRFAGRRGRCPNPACGEPYIVPEVTDLRPSALPPAPGKPASVRRSSVRSGSEAEESDLHAPSRRRGGKRTIAAGRTGARRQRGLAWWGGALAMVVGATVIGAVFKTVSRSPTGELVSTENHSGQAVAAAAVQPHPLSPQSFETHAAGFLQKYCIECHTGAEAEAGVALELYQDDAALQGRRKTWERVLELTQAGIMPPSDSAQPTPAEVEQLVTYLEPALNYIDCSAIRDPGRVTTRRLNRNEYNATVRDLLGVSLTPADDFPSDDVGYGFDNIGDVLSLSPLLLEKYLAAAETLASAAIVDIAALQQAGQHFPADQLTRSPAAKNHPQGLVLITNGEVTKEFEVEVAGKYNIVALAAGTRAGDQLPHLVLQLDGATVGEFDVAAEERELADYTATHTLTAGRHQLVARFTNDFYDDRQTDRSKRDRNLLIAKLSVLGPQDVDPATLPKSHRELLAAQPGELRTVLQAAQVNLAPFVRRAFRRPVSADEVDRFAQLVDLAVREGESFASAMRLGVAAVLVAPDFLYRLEKGMAQPTSNLQRLTDHELATRLSYFLWSSMPDATLSDLADRGALSDPAELERQVRRMLADSRASAFTRYFGEQWLQLRVLDEVTPDPTVFPDFNDELRRDMKEETLRCVDRIFRADRSVLDVLSGGETFLNERLAKHYGLTEPVVTGPEFRLVALDNARRSGVLTHASILTSTSNPNRTSPVKRGKWIMEVILDSPPPPAPPNVPELAAAAKAAPDSTLRQQLELHRSDPACASCHRQMDALGFGLENFDAVGRWRERDGVHPVDSSGILPDGSAFTGPRQLAETLQRRQRQYVETLAERLLTYALGRGLEYPDRCTIDRVVRAAENNGYRSSALLLEIVKSDPFRYRRAE